MALREAPARRNEAIPRLLKIACVSYANRNEARLRSALCRSLFCLPSYLLTRSRMDDSLSSVVIIEEILSSSLVLFPRFFRRPRHPGTMENLSPKAVARSLAFVADVEDLATSVPFRVYVNSV